MLFDNMAREHVSVMSTVLCFLKPLALFVACDKKVQKDSTELFAMDIGASLIEALFLVVGNQVW